MTQEKVTIRTTGHKEWVVRVVNMTRVDAPLSFGVGALNVGMLIECLRYAGCVTKVSEDEEVEVAGETYYKEVFDIHAPRDIGKGFTRSWAEQNAKRIQSFGVNAAAAPKITG